jgi:hypothetical protein
MIKQIRSGSEFLIESASWVVGTHPLAWKWELLYYTKKGRKGRPGTRKPCVFTNVDEAIKVFNSFVSNPAVNDKRYRIVRVSKEILLLC